MLALASCQTATPAPSTSPTGGVSSTALAEDPCHPGGVIYCALNPDVTPVTIRSTICMSGWTATVRPSSSYTSKLKSEQMVSERLPGTAADYEEDHRVPIELGGAPADPNNLSPEPYVGTPNNARVKDAGENLAKSWVCDQGSDLRQVQAAFVKRWLAPYPGYA